MTVIITAVIATKQYFEHQEKTRKVSIHCSMQHQNDSHEDRPETILNKIS